MYTFYDIHPNWLLVSLDDTVHELLFGPFSTIHICSSLRSSFWSLFFLSKLDFQVIRTVPLARIRFSRLIITGQQRYQGIVKTTKLL